MAIEFEDSRMYGSPIDKIRTETFAERRAFLPDLLIKMGIVSSQAAANIILILIAILCAVAAGYIFFVSMRVKPVILRSPDQIKMALDAARMPGIRNQ